MPTARQLQQQKLENDLARIKRWTSPQDHYASNVVDPKGLEEMGILVRDVVAGCQTDLWLSALFGWTFQLDCDIRFLWHPGT